LASLVVCIAVYAVWEQRKQTRKERNEITKEM